MVKKIKYYGVFVKRTIKNELPKEVIEVIKRFSKNGDTIGLGKSIIEVYVFYDELDQIECLANNEGIVVKAVDAVDKTDFMSQIEQLKEQYSDKEEASGNSCNAMVPASESNCLQD